MTVSTAFPPDQKARGFALESEYRDLGGGAARKLPQRIALIGQGNTASTYATTKRRVYSNLEVGQTYGFGSPLHLAAKVLMPDNGDGIGNIPLTVYPLEDDGAGVASAGDITPTVGTIVPTSARVKINNILSEAFLIETGDLAADLTAKVTTAINAVSEIPMVAADGTTTIDLTSKWKGASANDLYLEIVETVPSGVTWAFTQPVSGATNPDVDDALDQVGEIWETMILNCMDIADTATLTKISTFGEGRWGATTRKPLVSFCGNLNTTVANAIAVPDARKTDRTNACLVAPASVDLPFVTAGRQLARIASLANRVPAHDYGSQKADGLVPGVDGSQWGNTEKDAATKAGCSTIDSKDGVVYVADVLTFYHPTGEVNPAYSYVCDIVKLQNIYYNIDIEFQKPEWDGAPMVPDNQAVTEPTAKKPKNVRSAMGGIIDALAKEAIISDPQFSKDSIVVEIDGTNPKRWNLAVTVKLGGNSNVKSTTLYFGFHYGQAIEVV